MPRSAISSVERYLPAAVAFLSLSALSLIGSFLTRENYRENTQAQFEQIAEARVAAIRRSLNDKLLIIESMRALYAVYEGKAQPQFGSFVQPYEDEIPGIQALQWVVPVPTDQRDSFESARHAEGFTGYQITERRDGQMVRAGHRELYYPVYPVFPFDQGEQSVGFDIYSDITRRAALERAIQTGMITASERVTLLQAQDESGYGFLIFAPLFADGAASSSSSPSLLGLVLGVFRISDIVNSAIATLEYESVDLLLEDYSPGAHAHFLYQYTALRTDSPTSHKLDPAPYTSMFNFAGRDWAVTAVPAPGYMATRPANTSWLILTVGLLTSLLLATYLVLTTRHSLRLQAAETERNALENQLVQSQKMEAMGQLVGGIAHDFNNILTSLLGYSELAQIHNEDTRDKQMDDYLAKIVKGANRGKNLIQKMMAFSRSKTREEKWSNVDKEIRDSLEMISPLLSRHIQIDYNNKTLAGLPSIKMDPTSFGQVLINLCINARDAIQERGVIRIQLDRVELAGDRKCTACGASVEGDFISVSVSDDGEGIEAGDINDIFIPFYTTKEKGKGTGMGLAIINTIIHNNDGHIMVASVRGEGTTFEVLLPVPGY